MSIPTTARQYSFPELGSYNNLVVQDVPVAAPRANEVLVKTHTVFLQFRDLLVASGAYANSQVFPSNLVPCSDMAGEVIAVGEDVKQWKRGDRVSANFFLDKIYEEHNADIIASALGGARHGVLTEYQSFPAHSLVAIPDHLSYEEALTLPCAALTGYNALLSGFEPLKAGDTVLVQGTGGVSIFALQFAVASGATVIATSSSDEKLSVATKLGAKHVINYKKTPNWDEEVLKLTNGFGVDRVLEVAGNSTLQRSLNSVKISGSVDLIGALCGRVNVPPVDIVGPSVYKGLKIRGIFIGSVKQFKSMNKLLSGNIETTRPIIDKVFPFEEGKAVFAYLESQAHVGKVVIKV
ncbi:alcohol dehydrogenase superfamily protein [Mycena alexandri]|uniref:Alcohol dehydrogenase superfamily protein n=1 Tax=Mycena alexandri TaxID=1745969 RepID=A0AAD6SVC5_9AGAR|nr:alcohol dehydrogenase superfamily protein [Mycena alexandri]